MVGKEGGRMVSDIRYRRGGIKSMGVCIGRCRKDGGSRGVGEWAFFFWVAICGEGRKVFLICKREDWGLVIV